MPYVIPPLTTTEVRVMVKVLVEGGFVKVHPPSGLEVPALRSDELILLMITRVPFCETRTTPVCTVYCTLAPPVILTCISDTILSIVLRC